MDVTVDSRCLADPVTGTQVHALELIAALARENVHVRLLLPDLVHPQAAALLERMPANVEREPARSSVVHRPYQVAGPDDVDALRRFGERVIVTQQDLIGYMHAAYHPNEKLWRRQRAATRAALARADRIVFFSQFVASEAVAEGLVRPEDARVVLLGTDHSIAATAEPARPAVLASKTFLLCLGNDFAHKNRVFALAILRELVARHAWEGALVFAGSHVARGSSADDEAAYLAAHSDLAARVLDLGYVSDGEARWLLEHAQLVLYPSMVEGFGLVPFEAARAGTPCAFAPRSALAETLPEDASLLVPWDAASSAERVARVLRDANVARELVETIRRAGAELTWERTARSMIGVYEEAAASPPRRRLRDVLRLRS